MAVHSEVCLHFSDVSGSFYQYTTASKLFTEGERGELHLLL